MAPRSPPPKATAGGLAAALAIAAALLGMLGIMIVGDPGAPR